jgi:hypothetical protein
VICKLTETRPGSRSDLPLLATALCCNTESRYLFQIEFPIPIPIPTTSFLGARARAPQGSFAKPPALSGVSPAPRSAKPGAAPACVPPLGCGNARRGQEAREAEF